MSLNKTDLSQHLPLHVEAHTHTTVLVNPQGLWIAKMYGLALDGQALQELPKADLAEFLVRAANNHEELVAALKTLLEAHHDGHTPSCGYVRGIRADRRHSDEPPYICETCQATRAIAKAEGTEWERPPCT